MARQCVMHAVTWCLKLALKDSRKERRKEERQGLGWGQWRTGEAECGHIFAARCWSTQSFIVRFSLLFLQVGNFHNEKLGNALFSQPSFIFSFPHESHFYPLVEMPGVGGTAAFLSQSVVSLLCVFMFVGFVGFQDVFRQTVVSRGAGWELMTVYGIIWLGFETSAEACVVTGSGNLISFLFPYLSYLFRLVFFCPLATVSRIWPSGLWFACDLYSF